ncbi:MAG: c-type cytochrome [Betaproteobacteria bacterium]|nr:MAG: c-type cytochrome [Betaproteobacteria bacterium]
MQGRSWGGIAAGLFAGAVVFLSVGFASAANRWGADYFPNVPLVTQDGTTVHLYDDLLKGKSVAINVIYTSCKDECPLETARLAQLQRLLGERMGKDIFFYSITIDPKRDKPEVLKAYAEKYGVGPGWLFLTGKEEDIRLATKKLGLSRVRDSASKDGHSASLMVGNEPAGLWMRNSAVDNPQFLATTVGNFLGWKDTTPRKSYAEARPLVLDKGEYFFQSQCSVCHTIGQGDKMGPDLLGVTARRDRAWLNRYIMAPDKLLAEGDPIAVALFEKYQYARMPNLRLSSDEVAAVLSYVEGRSASLREPIGKDSVTAR